MQGKTGVVGHVASEFSRLQPFVLNSRVSWYADCTPLGLARPIQVCVDSLTKIRPLNSLIPLSALAASLRDVAVPHGNSDESYAVLAATVSVRHLHNS